jgi:hypothetical protein
MAVGNKPDSVSPVRRIDGTSWNNKRLYLVPFGFHVSLHLLEYHPTLLSKQSVNVFSDNPCRLNLPYNSEHLRPEEAVVARSLSPSALAERLAGEAARNNVNCSPVLFEIGFFDVFMQFCVFEEMFQDCPAKGVVLALENICPAAPLCR